MRRDVAGHYYSGSVFRFHQSHAKGAPLPQVAIAEVNDLVGHELQSAAVEDFYFAVLGGEETGRET